MPQRVQNCSAHHDTWAVHSSNTNYCRNACDKLSNVLKPLIKPLGDVRAFRHLQKPWKQAPHSSGSFMHSCTTQSCMATHLLGKAAVPHNILLLAQCTLNGIPAHGRAFGACRLCVDSILPQAGSQRRRTYMVL